MDKPTLKQKTIAAVFNLTIIVAAISIGFSVLSSCLEDYTKQKAIETAERLAEEAEAANAKRLKIKERGPWHICTANISHVFGEWHIELDTTDYIPMSLAGKELEQVSRRLDYLHNKGLIPDRDFTFKDIGMC